MVVFTSHCSFDRPTVHTENPEMLADLEWDRSLFCLSVAPTAATSMLTHSAWLLHVLNSRKNPYWCRQKLFASAEFSKNKIVCIKHYRVKKTQTKATNTKPPKKPTWKKLTRISQTSQLNITLNGVSLQKQLNNKQMLFSFFFLAVARNIFHKLHLILS